MTTANRPTFHPAVGRSNNSNLLTFHNSAKDQRGHTQLKYRQVGQASQQELRQEFNLKEKLREELVRKEEEYMQQKNKLLMSVIEEERRVASQPLLLTNVPTASGADADEPEVDYDDRDFHVDEDTDDFDSSEEEDNDEEDDEEELRRELEKIRQERAQAQAKKEQEEQEIAARLRQEDALRNNPISQIEQNSSVMKRRWNDDVVFRNQARDEPQAKKRFINDTIRSDFHRSFLKKYVS